jgi:hypothetical protein
VSVQSDAVYQRDPAVLFRMGADRVLACIVGRGNVVELGGALAVVWLALDEAARVDELIERIREAGVDPGDPSIALDELVGSGYVVVRGR